MAVRVLMVVTASTVFLLGVVHFDYTFWGQELTPRDHALQISMSQISPVITKETTVWRCWVGFNASKAWDLFCSAWFSVFSRWPTANCSFSHRSCSLSGWQCLVALLCSARFIFSVRHSRASAFLWRTNLVGKLMLEVDLRRPGYCGQAVANFLPPTVSSPKTT